MLEFSQLAVVSALLFSNKRSIPRRCALENIPLALLRSGSNRDASVVTTCHDKCLKRTTSSSLRSQEKEQEQEKEQPFPDLAQPETQKALRLDIGRRLTEIQLLGWLGRAILLLPNVFMDAVLPTVFRLDAYPNGTTAAPYREKKSGAVVITLKESSVGGPKGIPFTLRVLQDGNKVVKNCKKSNNALTLISIGVADLQSINKNSGSSNNIKEVENQHELLTPNEVQALCDSIDRRDVAAAITNVVFNKGPLAAVKKALEQDITLEVVQQQQAKQPISDNDELNFKTIFTPKEELWALEGTSYKWVQLRSGYYFARSELLNVRFVSGANKDDRDDDRAKAVTFQFYFDPTEPVNAGELPRQIINPEVIACNFDNTTN